ncbi:MAG: efflux RND transporter permease subunit, partial [Stenotrophobium sp.]
REGVREFIRSLTEAVIIVLLVSFFTLGFRPGLVVALTIPLVLALGLLVDDAIIAVEMMTVKMEQGWDRIRAAAHAYASTAFPMLTGTLVTAAGFLPIATAKSSTGEYTRSMFEVITIALLISWIAAVVFVPYLGYKLLSDHHAGAGEPGGHDPYQTRFYQRFRALVVWCVDRRKTVIGITVVMFLLSVAAFGLIPQQFFPASTRLELIVDLQLPEGASLQATAAAALRLEKILAQEKGIDNYVGYIGSGAPRFYLPLDQQLPAENFAQFVLTAKNIDDRERIRAHLIALFPAAFPDLRTRVLRLENGPPVGYPVQFRVSGDDPATLRALAVRIEAVVRKDPDVVNVHQNWDEPSKIVRLEIDQTRARALGVSSQSVAQFMQASLSGAQITTLRENNKLISVLLRGPPSERARLSLLGDTAIPRDGGGTVPLNQIARLEYGFEDGIIWRRDRIPTITICADVYNNVQPPVITARILPALASIRADLPPGYRIETGGTVEESAKGQNSVNAGIPLFIAVILTVLMFQLRSFSRVMMVVLTAPLGVIGVCVSLLLFRLPFGFVAMLGTIALSGMIMRNSVILVDQIEQDIANGSTPYDAIADATMRRLRPIVLTAMAAVLAMIPLSQSVFFGPMAVAIMGGLIAATALTLLFLPALYAAWFRIRRPVALTG